MRTSPPQSWACDRARQAASVGLDAELSQLERALLDRHLERCAACAEFAADLASITVELRAAAPVQLEVPISLPLRRRAGYAVRNLGAWMAAASVAATALLAVLTLPAQRTDSAPVIRPGGYQRTNQDLRDLRALRIAQMKPPAQSLARSVHGQQLET